MPVENHASHCKAERGACYLLQRSKVNEHPWFT